MRENNKILTISIAAYNVDKFLDKTLQSLYKCKNLEKIEVLIINDGSADRTEEIAKKYVEKNSRVFRLVTKENGGYGSTINTSISMARGKYYKLLDGDDWYESDNLNEYIFFLEMCDKDCVYSPYWAISDDRKVLYKCENNKKRDGLQADCICMHALAFRTKLLKNNDIIITEKCFYTDAEYNLKALLYVQSIDYFEKPIYCYRLGNEGQSVSKTGWLKHYKEHNKVTLEIMKAYTDAKVKGNSIWLEEELIQYIKNIYKTNFFIAVNLKNKEVWNNYICLEKAIETRFPVFLKYANIKMKIIKGLRYKVVYLFM